MKLKPKVFYPLQINSEFQLSHEFSFQVLETSFAAEYNQENKCFHCQNEPKQMIVFPCKHKCLCEKCGRKDEFAKYPACPQCFGIIHCMSKE